MEGITEKEFLAIIKPLGFVDMGSMSGKIIIKITSDDGTQEDEIVMQVGRTPPDLNVFNLGRFMVKHRKYPEASGTNGGGSTNGVLVFVDEEEGCAWIADDQYNLDQISMVDEDWLKLDKEVDG